VTTPAGKFEAQHYRIKEGSGDPWVSEKVSPYGLIKHQGKDLSMVLIRLVSDAKDKITGTPAPFNSTNMGMGGPPARCAPLTFVGFPKEPRLLFSFGVVSRTEIDGKLLEIGRRYFGDPGIVIGGVASPLLQ
jgi:hypothetical protein